jgi:ribosomal protein S18 acetylase RimI-like enzyme
MADAEYEAWLAEAIPGYAADKVASGQWSQEEALDRSRRGYEELLPLGLKTPENFLYTITDDETSPVGVLWFAIKVRFSARIAYVFDIAISPTRQRQGHAYRAFQALEEEVRKLGLTGVALHVFGHNTAAQALYAKLGYKPTNISLFKRVGPAGA